MPAAPPPLTNEWGAFTSFGYAFPTTNRHGTDFCVKRADFVTLYPRASEAVIRLNCTDWETPRPSTPAEKRLGPAKAKESPKKRVARVPRTRNAGTWTEAEMWGRIRSCLRRMSIYWRPARQALLAARIPFRGPRGQKWAFLCADCQKLFKRSQVELDHVIACGSLRCYADVGAFLERLLPEDANAYKVRCRSCHRIKTNADRETHLREKK